MDSILLKSSFNDLIDEQLKGIECSLEETEAYIKNTFTRYIKPDVYLSNKNITLLYIKANDECNFKNLQDLADWLFFLNSIHPDSLNCATPEYYNTVAQLSYYRCYNILNGQWKVYEELADRLPYFIEYIKVNLKNS